MFTIIGGDGKEYGPVSAEQVRTWLANGRANLSTKAKYAGTEEWHTLGEYTEFVGTGAGGVPATAEVVTQRDVNIREFAADLIARAAPLDVFGCIGRSFSLWTSNFLPLVGVTLLVGLAMAVATAIPILGMVSGLLLNGVFYGGLYYYYLGKIRGEPRDVGDAFGGFSRAFVPLMLANVMSSLIVLALVFLFCAPIVMFAIGFAMQGAQHTHALPAFGMLTLLGILFGFLVLMYLSVSWIFTFALVIDQGLGPWTAMEVSRRVVSKQWFRVFFVLVLGVICTMLGLFGLIIGVFFTLPLMFGAIMYAYEDLCNPPPRA